jgi:peptide/nickel transport system permease protein
MHAETQNSVVTGPFSRGSGEPRSALSRLLREAARLRRFQTGLVLATLALAVALIGPFAAPYSPTEFVAAPFAMPSAHIPFGADYLGRDVLSRFLCGGLSLLLISVPATLLGVGLGAALGIAAAMFKGVASEGSMRMLDVLLAFPQVVLSLLFITVLGPRPWLLIGVVALAHFPQSTRVLRGAAADVVERDFVKAAQIIGMPRHKIVFEEVLPNVGGQLLVELGLRFTYSIGIIAALSFLGFGRQPPNPDWGLMISENKVALLFQPWGTLLPVLAIAVLTVGVNLVADAIGRVSARIQVREDAA